MCSVPARKRLLKEISMFTFSSKLSPLRAGRYFSTVQLISREQQAKLQPVLKPKLLPKVGVAKSMPEVYTSDNVNSNVQVMSGAMESAMNPSPSTITYTGGHVMPITTRLHIVTPDEDTPRGTWPLFRLMVSLMRSAMSH
jgi:hypothetical protein